VNAVRPPGAATQTVWHSRDGTYRLPALASCDDAFEKLAELGALYAGGLRSPLRFFPNAAWALVTRNANVARQAWNAGKFPEKDDPAHALALRGVDDPLGVGFESIAHAVFDPLLAHLVDPRLGA
jgi:exodeoxyribonuclease V gamma subunit